MGSAIAESAKPRKGEYDMRELIGNIEENGLKDKWSAITHFIGMLMTMLAAVPLLMRAANAPDKIHLVSLGIFVISMILLYGASTTYHSVRASEKIQTVLRKIDHMMIFVLIAGSYTPICLVVLSGRIGYVMLALVWGIALAGIVIKLCWITCPKWFSSALYIAVGWVCLMAFSKIYMALEGPAFYWLLAGGLIYTVGGIIYALKVPGFDARHKSFGSHEIFHLFVMGGSICHFILMFQYITVFPV